MGRMMRKLLCCLMLAAVICGALWTGNTASTAGPAKGPDEGVKDICVFLPYDGTSEEVVFSALAATGKRLAECTGGNLIQYKGAAATIDALADAVENSAVVIIGSHGLSGFITLTTDAGLT